MPRLHITATIEIPEGQREQARIMAALDVPAEAFEQAIREASGVVDAKIEMRVIKNKAASMVPPAIAPEPAVEAAPDPEPVEYPSPRSRRHAAE